MIQSGEEINVFSSFHLPAYQTDGRRPARSDFATSG